LPDLRQKIEDGDIVLVGCMFAVPKELLFIWLYFACGFLLAVFGDSQQMKKHVPYGEVPAILSLRAIRIMNFVIITLIGTP